MSIWISCLRQQKAAERLFRLHAVEAISAKDARITAKVAKLAAKAAHQPYLLANM